MNLNITRLTILALTSGWWGCGSPGSTDDAGRDSTEGVDSISLVDSPSGGDAPDVPGSNIDLNRSGTRIKMRIGTTPDGARTFLGWHDVVLGRDCAFGPAADGATRCIPLGGAGVGAFYSDSGCTQQLAAVSLGECPPPPPPAYASSSAPACTGSSRYVIHVYRVAGTYSGMRYTGTPANCTPSTLTGYEFYALGAEVPAADLAGVTETLE